MATSSAQNFRFKFRPPTLIKKILAFRYPQLLSIHCITILVKFGQTFGVVVQGSGFNEIQETQLFLFGGAFNTFIRTQELEQSRIDSTN